MTSVSLPEITRSVNAIPLNKLLVDHTYKLVGGNENLTIQPSIVHFGGVRKHESTSLNYNLIHSILVPVASQS